MGLIIESEARTRFAYGASFTADGVVMAADDDIVISAGCTWEHSGNDRLSTPGNLRIKK